MSELISGKKALTRVAEGIVQYKCDEAPIADRWTTITDHFWDQYNLGVFLNENTTWKFCLKPRTITINGIEVVKPQENMPKKGDEVFTLDFTRYEGYVSWTCQSSINTFDRDWWKSEDEIKQVVAALKKIFVINNQ